MPKDTNAPRPVLRSKTEAYVAGLSDERRERITYLFGSPEAFAEVLSGKAPRGQVYASWKAFGGRD